MSKSQDSSIIPSKYCHDNAGYLFVPSTPTFPDPTLAMNIEQQQQSLNASTQSSNKERNASTLFATLPDNIPRSLDIKVNLMTLNNNINNTTITKLNDEKNQCLSDQTRLLSISTITSPSHQIHSPVLVIENSTPLMTPYYIIHPDHILMNSLKSTLSNPNNTLNDSHVFQNVSVKTLMKGYDDSITVTPLPSLLENIQMAQLELAQKKLRYQEKNRMAAMKSRSRKKQEWIKLIESEAALKEENEFLRNKIKILEEQLRVHRETTVIKM